MRIRLATMFLFLAVAAPPITAFADGTNTTTYTTSTRNIYDTSYAAVSQQVNTFSVELIASLQGGATVYDQTFNVAYADPAVQAAITTAQAALTASGAASFNGPTLLTGSTSLVGSVSQIGAPVDTGTDVSFATTLYIGPQTIMVGDNQSQIFSIPAGSQDYDTLVTSLIHQLITTTTTDTYLTTDVYQLVGVPAQSTAPVPEPGTILLLVMGAPAMLFFRGKKRKKNYES